MNADLAELLERVEFSRTEIVILKNEIDNFAKHGVTIRTSSGANNTYDIYIGLTKPVPVRIRSRAGTIANELRSCLDGLACVLALRNGMDTSQTYFPISKSEEIFNDDGQRKLKKVADADKKKIASLRPSRTGNPLLFALHEADRTRKHIRLGGCGNGANEAIFGGNIMIFVGGGSGRVVNCNFNGVHVADMTYFGGVARDVNNEVRIAIGVPVNLPVTIKAGVSYTDPPELEGKPLVPQLTEFAALVENIIISFNNEGYASRSE